VADTGSHKIGAFHQEGAVQLAVLAQVQRRRPLDEGVTDAGDGLA